MTTEIELAMTSLISQMLQRTMALLAKRKSSIIKLLKIMATLLTGINEDEIIEMTQIF